MVLSLLASRRTAWPRKSNQRKLVMGLAFSAISKYIEKITSAGAEVRKTLGMVLEVGDQAVQGLGVDDRLD
jgi:hypothetical protein